MLTDETHPDDFENKRESNTSPIKGWGIDANPENDPTYPMKKRTDEEHKGLTWERPPQQTETVEILKSVERPDLTSVFGDSTPPKGLSGAIRRAAYKYSESSYGRWLPLIVADRIGIVEGLIDDLMKGHIPNRIKERGWSAEWKYNRKSFVQKIGFAAGLITVTTLMCLPKRHKRRRFF
ncbi:MAG: hypothetical protein ACM3Q2_12395 [Syntrophothermus sp.]